MTKKYLTLCFAALLAVFMLFFAEHSLNYIIKRKIKDFPAVVGVAVLKDNKTWTLGKTKQPLLSVYKIFIALRVLSKLENNSETLDTGLLIKPSDIDKSLYSPMLKKYKYFPCKITIRELMEYMISYSDNNASDILLNYTGGPVNLEIYLHSLGFENVEISASERDMKDINKQYLNKAYPVDVLKILKFAIEGDVLSLEHRMFLKNIMLKTSTGKGKLKAGLPEGVLIAHKTGTSSRKKDGVKIADNDAGFVIFPDGKMYYIAVFITDSKMSDVENQELIAKVSKVVYDYVLRHKRPHRRLYGKEHRKIFNRKLPEN